MTRARSGSANRRSKKRWFQLAAGNRGNRSKNWRKVREAVIRAGVYATRDRRRVKREYRSLWITRLTAVARANGLSYSRLTYGLKLANIILNRKMLSEIAIADAATFVKIVEQAKEALSTAPKVAA